MRSVYSTFRRLIPFGFANICPACGEETMRGGYSRLLGGLQHVVPAKLSRRWCRRCSWRGIAISRPGGPQPGAGHEVSEAEWAAAATARAAPGTTDRNPRRMSS